jgi:phosphoribosylformylglycinamidine synthase subunit PurL
MVGAIEGMGIACRALGVPVVSGNVSLYNETNGVGIPPTPAIGAVGLVPDVSKMAGIGLSAVGDVLLVIGRCQGWLGQSLYQRHATGRTWGAPPPVDLADELKVCLLVREAIRAGTVRAVHDVSDGGLLVAVAEMALAGSTGAQLEPAPSGLPEAAWWFGEDQGRFVVAVPPRHVAGLAAQAHGLGLPALRIGIAAGEALAVGEDSVSLADLRTEHEGWLPQYMA